jgi:hypothetical protein
VIDADDMDDPFGLIDAVDDPVCTATCGVIVGEFAGKRLADPMRIVQ